MNNFLRTIYDKSTIVKGTKRDDEIKSYKARASLIISGEELPNDSALNSRCITFPVYASQNRTISNPDFLWMMQNKAHFKKFAHSILKNVKTLWPKIQGRIDAYMEKFKDEDSKNKISSRQGLHASIIAGVVDEMMGESDKYTSFISTMAHDQNRNRIQEEALNVYYSDVSDLYNMGRIDFDFIRHKVLVDKNGDNHEVVYFYMNGMYAMWEHFYRGLRSELPASKTALIEHIKRETYYKGTRNVRLGKGTKFCIVLDFEDSNFPDQLKDIITDMRVRETSSSLMDSSVFDERKEDLEVAESISELKQEESSDDIPL